MRIDAYTHFFPKKFFDKLNEVAGDYKDMGKRVRSLPALYDLDVRKKIVDGHKDYQQILSYPQPPIERFAKTPARHRRVLPHHQRRLRRTVREGEGPFPGLGGAGLARCAPTPASPRRSARSRTGALGVQIYTNVAGKPLDRPQYLPFWKKMNELGKPIWLHPARGAEMPDYIDEKKSLYEIWWTLGWSYETACAMMRLVYSKIMDNHPNLKIITHHFGGIVPMLEGRLGPGNDVMGSRTTRRGLRLAAQEPQEAPARLLQAGLLGRHRGVHGGAGDQGRHGVLPAREDRLRLRLPVRSGRRHDVSARDAADPRLAQHSQGRPRERSTTRTWRRSPA